MSHVRNKYCLALVSRHSTAPGRDETFAKIWGMDDPLSKTLTTSQRRILPEYSALRTVMFRAATRENTPLSSAQHLDISRAVVLHQNRVAAHQSMEAVAEWI